jgi:hypothetical protein
MLGRTVRDCDTSGLHRGEAEGFGPLRVCFVVKGRAADATDAPKP